MRPLELLLERVDLLVAETRAIPLQLPLQAETRLIVVGAARHAAGVAVVTPAVRLVRVRATLELGYCNNKTHHYQLSFARTAITGNLESSSIALCSCDNFPAKGLFRRLSFEDRIKFIVDLNAKRKAYISRTSRLAYYSYSNIIIAYYILLYNILKIAIVADWSEKKSAFPKRFEEVSRKMIGSISLRFSQKSINQKNRNLRRWWFSSKGR